MENTGAVQKKVVVGVSVLDLILMFVKGTGSVWANNCINSITEMPV
jgi:hypothetical protein